MNDVEKRIAMPEGAGPIDDCSRFYAFNKNGRVQAAYLVGHLGGLEPGQRRWTGSVDAFPQVLDGGCGNLIVTVEPSGKIWAACAEEA